MTRTTREPSAVALWFAVLSALAFMTPAVTPTGTVTAATPGFPFSPSYGQPTVPASVGAQGVQGPNVPLSKIGPQGVSSGIEGAHGFAGIGGFASPATSTVTVQAYYGSPLSRTAAAGATVSLVNATTGVSRTATTSAGGVATLSVPAGWYILVVQEGAAVTAYTNFTGAVDLTTATASLTRYMLPNSDASVTVTNGPGSANFGTYFVKAVSMWEIPGVLFTYDVAQTQIQLQLINTSASPAKTIANVTTLANSTGEFNHINEAYSYEVNVIGWNNSFSGLRLFELNDTFNLPALTVPGQNKLFQVNGVNAQSGKNVWAGTTFTGSSPNYEAWNVAQNTVASGGTMYLSCIPVGTSKSLTFQNMVLYLNMSTSDWSTMNVAFVDTTVIALMAGNWFSQGAVTNLWFNSSEFLASALPTTFHAGTALPITTATGSNFEYLPFVGSGIYSPYVNGAISGSWIGNSSLVLAVNLTLANDTMFNVSLNPYVPNSVAYTTYPNSLTVSGSILEGNTTLQAYGGRLTMSRTVTFASDVLSNGTIGATVKFFNVTNSYLNTTISGETFGDYNTAGTGFTGHLTNDFLSFPVPTYLNLAAFYRASANNGHHYNFYWTNGTNASYTEFYGAVLPSVNVSFYVQNLAMYDDIVFDNYTQAELSAFAAAFTTTPSTFTSVWIGTFQERVAYNLTMNYTLEQTGGIAYPIIYTGYTYLCHDFWPWSEYVSQWPSAQFFGNFNTHPVWGGIYATNDTWGYESFNVTRDTELWNFFFQPGGEDIIQDTQGGSTSLPAAIFDVSYDTFDAGLVGSGSNQNAFVIGFGEPNVIGLAEHDLFLNLPTHLLGIRGPLFHPQPYYGDVVSAAGVNTVTNDWFLNLNNITLPIAANYGLLGSPSSTTIGQNHYFFSTVEPLSSANPAGAISKVQINAACGNTVYGEPLCSTVAYEIPTNYQGAFTAGSANMGQLVSNSSILQTGPTGIDAASHSYSWTIAPDVNTSSGVAVVSYLNGLTAGPQPNFYWHGYNYSESVEPSYVQIGVNSTHAPPVTVVLSAPGVSPYGAAQLSEFYSGNGTPISSAEVFANSEGAVNVTYNPATMPASVIFSLTIYTPPLTDLVIPLVLILAVVGGVAVGLSGVFFGVTSRRRSKRAEAAARVALARGARRTRPRGRRR